MEIKGSEFAELVGVTPQNIYGRVKIGKLTKTEAGNYNIHDPLNSQYLKAHGKSSLDVEKFMNGKKKPAVSRSAPLRTPRKEQKTASDSTILINAVKRVVIDRYGEKDSKIVLKSIFQEVKRLEST